MTADRAQANTRPPDSPLLLELEIDQQTPLEGLVSSATGVVRPFTGWAGLAATLTTFLDDWDQADERDADTGE